jgi:hypothetical protein
MSKATDLTGLKYDRLTIIERRGTDEYGRALWLGKCVCGGHRIVSSSEFSGRANLHCGCMTGKLKPYYGTRHKHYDS